ncbi:3-hydroxybutyrate dehydrogenase [Marinomonas mediterranea]|jgi:3-hydroxybutyrate dehydrogenase|uniref:3-hydroxybutyrate dehydrogenase n=1 Tax=Marinomonas mediterranea (strain ATCC 700492 / JCM 21426 / NBRC 103028 / MMB-1) TaxID=717774 RepID=F2JUB8_MARM1|nr:3-hydroxybutyrate dehydrogenase [Marinomonas mediterranea]ADZ92737.1 3-hydroxybutyrate dehydrogenase [Marinomonas mediterranea MMB-1]WCN10667.1 3-hydroxybutyrate dehydrogenase [Marinomonas mediterranea]WCN14724.1 3-hydroxybutyrate dehydrogenase [Marinomonas mediterranea]WCN18765.1 3-hydroxybutyrate dehydrogenase [Marinomonas mediterranea MMB-1]
MNNKTVLITGAASGIGLEIAQAFLKADMNVAILDFSQTAIEEAKTQLSAFHQKCTFFACDVTKEPQFMDAIDAAIAQFGHIDILINNAGVQHIAPIEEFPSDTYRRLIDIMLIAPFLAIKKILPLMKEKGDGRIINMSSINGLIGFAGKAGYNSAKHGVIGLTKVAALEAAPFGVTINALCPGYVDTPLVRNQLEDLAKTRNVSLDRVLEEVIWPLVPQRRFLTVDEISDYCLFLSSPSAKGVTGQAIVIDGGYTTQ